MQRSVLSFSDFNFLEVSLGLTGSGRGVLRDVFCWGKQPTGWRQPRLWFLVWFDIWDNLTAR
jgi:hypothetical protein